MLTNLTVSNFAIINNISIDFKDHLTVLTGETGAGKSLIIDAISLLLGGRASCQMIRDGENKATIEGVFTFNNKKISAILDELDIEYTDNTIIIRRDINRNGKSISRINGYIVTLNQLEKISSLLADIHSQLDTKKLFDLHNFIEFIDDETSISILKVYRKNRNEYLKTIKEYQNIKISIEKNRKDLDYYLYRYNELVSLKLDKDEINKLELELNVLTNFELIYNNLSTIKDIFNNQELSDTLYLIKQSLDKLSIYDENFKEYSNIVNTSYYDLIDLENYIDNKLRNLEFDNSRIDVINERLNTLKDVQRRYKLDVNGLLKYINELKNIISDCESSDYIIEKKQEEVVSTFKKLRDISLKLSNRRKELAIKLKDNIKTTLIDLCLPKVSLDFIFNNCSLNDPFDCNIFKENGIDEVDLMISFNSGEAMKSIGKIASGGEMSRVMLAIKTHMINNLGLSLVVFDEIDTGISGEVAKAVAKKIKSISNKTQVLAISHLPIVAACANQQLKVNKEVVCGRTNTFITELTEDERIKYIAWMISSTKSDETSLVLAKNLIDSFKEYV